MKTNSLGKYLLIFCLIIIVGFIGYKLLYAPDMRSTEEKISDAVDELPNGVDKAARQLESRTPADKIGDAVKDTTDDLKKTTNQQ